jgi:hypothetical protein
LSRTFSWGSS